MTSTKGKSKRPLVRFQNEQKRFRLSESRIRRLAEKILLFLKLKVELHLTFVSDAQIRRLNKLFHAADRATDVLAFPNPQRWPGKENGPEFLGEIIVSVERAIAQSKQFQSTQDEELIRYVAHGILHLIGESDANPRAQKKMFKRQEKIIKQLKPISKILLSSPRRQGSL